MDIINQFGVGDYMKIEIERYDRVCIDRLSGTAIPNYLSTELNSFQGDQDIEKILELEYRKFKIMAQNSSRIGESGPWGESTSGSWHSDDHARSGLARPP